jgi:hypothetical protein
MCISRRILLRMRNVSGKRCRENQNTYLMFSTFFPEYRALYEIMRKKYVRVKQITDDNTIRQMRVACCIIETTDTRP